MFSALKYMKLTNRGDLRQLKV